MLIAVWQVARGQKGATREKELGQRKLAWESVTDGVEPVRLPQDGEDQGHRPAPLKLTDLECTRKLGACSALSVRGVAWLMRLVAR